MARLAANRDALLSGIPPAVVASLPAAPDPSAQILRDLDVLNTIGQLADGSIPLTTWLNNAVTLLEGRVEAETCRQALHSMGRPVRFYKPGDSKATRFGAATAVVVGMVVCGMLLYNGWRKTERVNSPSDPLPATNQPIPTQNAIVNPSTEPKPLPSVVHKESSANSVNSATAATAVISPSADPKSLPSAIHKRSSINPVTAAIVTYRGFLRNIVDGSPIPGAQIILIGTRCITNTDKFGVFNFNACTDHDGVSRLMRPTISIGFMQLDNTWRRCLDVPLEPLPQMTKIELNKISCERNTMGLNQD